MKNRWRIALVAVAVAGLAWPAGRVQALCTTSLADTTNPDCKLAKNCQAAISAAAVVYVNTVQKTIAKLMKNSQGGLLKKGPNYRCIGGPNDGKKCLATNGVCKAATNSAKGRLCSVDVDCGASAPAGACNRNAGTGCNTGFPDNTYECQVNQAKDPYAGAIAKAQSTLKKSIFKKCVDPIAVPAATVGITNILDCPGAAGAATDEDAYNALVQCIQQSVGGDLTSGNVIDANELALQISSGTGALPPNNKFGSPPRMLLQLEGTQLLQLGTAAPSNNGETPGGAIRVLNLAHCVGGNGNGFCINDTDCGKDELGATGVCTENPTVLGEVTFTGAPVFTPGDANSLGPVLNVQATCANSIPTCLVTHTRNAGNDTTANGSINLTTGHYSSAAPIVTDVYVYGATDCATARPCPVCDATSKACVSPDLHPFTAGACDAADQSVTIECLPSGGTSIHIPNPFVLTTEPKFMLPASGNKFCGYCDNNAAGGCQGGATMCANGCQTLSDCSAVAGATVCDFGGTADGFLGNTGTSLITAPGIDNQYEPLVSGIFCTGITSNGTVNGAAGLPGPVRVVLPYTLGYVVGNN